MRLTMILWVFISGISMALHARADSRCVAKVKKYGHAQFQVEVSEYEPLGVAQKSMLIVPPTGGTNLIDRSYAKNFCAKGYRVFILNGWTGDVETVTDLEIHQSFYGKAQQAIDLVMAEIHTPFVGLIGTSVGALHASVAASRIPRLNAVFAIVGGTPIAEVIVNSDQQAMRDLRDSRMKRFGFVSGDANIAAIERVFHLEPTTLGDLFRGKDLGMVVASGDTTVPFETQSKLRDFWAPKKLINLDSSHFWAIVKTWLFHTDELLDFFEDSAKRLLKKRSQ